MTNQQPIALNTNPKVNEKIGALEALERVSDEDKGKFIDLLCDKGEMKGTEFEALLNDFLKVYR